MFTFKKLVVRLKCLIYIVLLRNYGSIKYSANHAGTERPQTINSVASIHLEQKSSNPVDGIHGFVSDQQQNQLHLFKLMPNNCRVVLLFSKNQRKATQSIVNIQSHSKPLNINHLTLVLNGQRKICSPENYPFSALLAASTTFKSPTSLKYDFLEKEEQSKRMINIPTLCSSHIETKTNSY